MKYLIILFSIFLFSKEIDPQWIKGNFPKDGAIYFLGVSPLYLTNDAYVEEKAQSDALKSAFEKVSAYFGISINSELNINKEVFNNSSITFIRKKLQTKSAQLIFNLKPYKTYKKYFEDGKYFRFYVLLKLDKKTEKKIKNYQQKEIKEFKNLEKKLLKAIDKGDLFKAKNLLALLKAKRVSYMFENEIMAIENRLNSLLNGYIKVYLRLDKREYLPDESIKVEVSIDKDAYLYVLYNMGNEIEMIFPNEERMNNYIKNQELIVVNDYIDIIADEDLIGKNPSIIAIASKDRLFLERYGTYEDGIYVFDNFKQIEPILNKCKKEAKCFIVKKEFKVVAFKKPKYQLILDASSYIKKEIFDFLKSKGIKNTYNKNKLLVTIREKKIYSNELGVYIPIFYVEAVYKKNKIKKSVSGIDALNTLILELLQ